MSPEQKELTQRLRRRAFRNAGDKPTAKNLLRLADSVAGQRFTQPPRALLAQFRAEDPFMADLDLPAKRPARPPRVETIYEARTGNRRLLIERERGGEIAIRVSQNGGAEEFMFLDAVQERQLRKAFAIHPEPTWEERQHHDQRRNRP